MAVVMIGVDPHKAQMSRNAPGVSPAIPARLGQIRRELPLRVLLPVGALRSRLPRAQRPLKRPALPRDECHTLATPWHRGLETPAPSTDRREPRGHALI